MVALIATFTLWSQVGGQGHLDLMAWYWKLLLSLGVAAAAVKATLAAVEHEQAWNPRTLRWLAVIITLLIACGVVTYYYHLYEPDEQDEQSVTQSTSLGRSTAPRYGLFL